MAQQMSTTLVPYLDFDSIKAYARDVLKFENTKLVLKAITSKNEEKLLLLEIVGVVQTDNGPESRKAEVWSNRFATDEEYEAYHNSGRGVVVADAKMRWGILIDNDGKPVLNEKGALQWAKNPRLLSWNEIHIDQETGDVDIIPDVEPQGEKRPYNGD